jgi:hypothetical protein
LSRTTPTRPGPKFSGNTSLADHSGQLRILVPGYIVRGPRGGLAWHHLQYVMGLRDLGHDVYFLEDSEDYAACYNPERDDMGTDPTYGLRFATDAFARVGLGDRWAYWDVHIGQWLGPAGGRRSSAPAPIFCSTSRAGSTRSTPATRSTVGPLARSLWNISTREEYSAAW